MSAIRVHTLAERPGLAPAFLEMPTTWPPFMYEDPVAWLLGPIQDELPEYHLVALDGEEPVAYARSVPFDWTGEDDDLPNQGWDLVVGRAYRAHQAGRTLTAVSALEITVNRDRQGEGISGVMVAAMRDNARARGLDHLVAPVRPSQKHLEPHTPIAEYAFRIRPDGLPFDAWLRVHVRAGARIVKPCTAAMAIAGSLSEWRRWTGLPIDSDGDVVVPRALVPVNVSLAHDRAVYVEPNVWVHHRL